MNTHFTDGSIWSLGETHNSDLPTSFSIWNKDNDDHEENSDLNWSNVFQSEEAMKSVELGSLKSIWEPSKKQENTSLQEKTSAASVHSRTTSDSGDFLLSDFSDLINRIDGWGSQTVSQSTEWDVSSLEKMNRTGARASESESNVWMSQPPTGVNVWEDFYERRGLSNRRPAAVNQVPPVKPPIRQWEEPPQSVSSNIQLQNFPVPNPGVSSTRAVYLERLKAMGFNAAMANEALIRTDLNWEKTIAILKKAQMTEFHDNKPLQPPVMMAPRMDSFDTFQNLLDQERKLMAAYQNAQMRLQEYRSAQAMSMVTGQMQMEISHLTSACIDIERNIRKVQALKEEQYVKIQMGTNNNPPFGAIKTSMYNNDQFLSRASNHPALSTQQPPSSMFLTKQIKDMNLNASDVPEFIPGQRWPGVRDVQRSRGIFGVKPHENSSDRVFAQAPHNMPSNHGACGLGWLIIYDFFTFVESAVEDLRNFIQLHSATLCQIYWNKTKFWVLLALASVEEAREMQIWLNASLPAGCRIELLNDSDAQQKMLQMQRDLRQASAAPNVGVFQSAPVPQFNLPL